MMKIIAFNKPYGVICQFSAHEKYGCLKDYLDVPNVYPAGRLDADSEGLLLLTDDGRVQAQIAHPKNKMLKTYWAQVEGVPDEAALNHLHSGVNLGDFVSQPAQAKIIAEPADLWQRHPPIRVRKTIPDTWLSITLAEGKNRQVRRMCAKVGYPCLRLIRVAVGQIHLMDLALGVGEYCSIDWAKYGR